ncbi:hypothetical protein LTR09_010292 [Extremus antarcticus]|uniref:Uncharacterized protein n=1 Tax=Extremus antarcticus TaxID=702011 RepID=A0AAJ0G551_9PEZI|nr:hypothetical protein LTR09_010292 [Extremus antarcticus]
MTQFNLNFEAKGEDMRIQTTLQYARMIFDYLWTLSGSLPFVVDGDDIVWRADGVKDGLCKGLGLDSTRIHESWEPTPDEERPSNEYIWQFTKVAHESTGIQQLPSQPTIPSIEKAFEGWSQSYGSEVASHLRCLVEAETPHYEYLQRFKI